MITLFNPPFIPNRTPVSLPMYNNIMGFVRTEYKKVKQFYLTNFIVTPTNHNLIKLLHDLIPFIQFSPEVMVQQVRLNTPRLERQHKLNSSTIYSGPVDTGFLYNRHCPEVYISTQFDIDIANCMKNWQRLKPLRPVAHPFTDLTFPLLNGQVISPNKGVCVFTIDLALLALQLKGWWEVERFNKEENLHLPLTRFLAKYVLLNAVDIHTDIAIFNRLKLLALDQRPDVGKNTHSFLVLDNGDRLDKIHLELLSRFEKQPMTYIQKLESIPSLEYSSFWRSIGFPDTAPTRQIKWALILSKLNVLELLLHLDDQNTNMFINQYEREIIARELRVIINDRGLLMGLDTDTHTRILSIYQQVSRE